MNLTKITLSVALAGALTLGLADAPTQTTPTIDVDAQIAKIQNAPADQRVELMNEFKQQVASMNAEQRQEVVSQMQAKMAEMNHQGQVDGQTHAQMAQERAMEHATDMQQRTETQREQMEQMSQHQAGGQFMHQEGGNVQPHMDGMQTGSMPTSGGQTGGSDMQTGFMHH